MDESNLAIIFGPNFMRPFTTSGNESLNTLIEMPFQSRIVELLLIHKNFIFEIVGNHSSGTTQPVDQQQNVKTNQAEQLTDVITNEVCDSSDVHFTLNDDVTAENVQSEAKKESDFEVIQIFSKTKKIYFVFLYFCMFAI